MYIDTSALVKLFVDEPDSEACEAAVSGETLVSSTLLHCEFRSALLGKESRGAISSDLRAELWKEFESRIAAKAIILLSIDDRVVGEAEGVLEELYPFVPLRTLDALHLATCLSVERVNLFTCDRRMQLAARRLGVPLLSLPSH